MENNNLVKKKDFATVLLQNNFSIWYETMFKYMWGYDYIYTEGNDKIFKTYDKIYNMEVSRAILNAPPRIGKTIQSAAFMAYCCLKGSCNFIYVSASKEILALVRKYLEDIFKNPRFLDFYPTPYNELDNPIEFQDKMFEDEYFGVEKDERNKMAFSTRRIILGSSEILLLPRGSVIIGRAAGRVTTKKEFTGGIILDDIENTEDSDYVKDKIHNWYSGNILTRLENKDAIILNVQQRISQNDMSAYLEKVYNFKVFKFPLLNESNEVQFLKTKYNVEELKKNNYNWQSMYLQDPITKGGEYVKTEWLKNYEVLPRLSYTVISCDTAMKVSEKNDYSVFMFAGITDKKEIYILDVLRGKWEANELLLQLRNFYAKCKSRIRESIPQPLQIFIEDKASGIGLIQSLKSFNLPVEPINPGRKSKADRMMDVLPIIASGYVNIPAVAEWRYDFINELEAFPNSRHDDICDSLQIILSNYDKINTFWGSI